MEKDTRSSIHFMQQTQLFDLENKIIAALTDSRSESWFPHLTFDLMQNGLQKLYDEMEFTEADYGTTRVILKDVNAERVFEGAIFTRNDLGEIKNETFVEILPAGISNQYKESGVNFYSREELGINTEITDCLRDAFEIIRHVPSLFSTVRHLVKSIHLIKPEDNEYDVSFSEPHIPFSIFVSVPQKNNPINNLRVAEAIVHEAMHLQLTLIEDIIQLIINSNLKFYSPWKSEYRTAGGVLHALYVFRVLYSFWDEVIKHDFLILLENNYLNNRRNLIIEQILEIEHFSESKVLTHLGEDFVAKMLFY